MSKLFNPLKVGRMNLSHRIAMAPMTRTRADGNHVPFPIVKDHYEQRSCIPGTFLITEATVVSPRHGGYNNVPGIWNKAQIEAWEKVTRAVHDKGAYIYLQIWAMGRTANPQFMKQRGYDLVSASDVPMKSQFSGEMHHPKPLTESGITESIEDFSHAARNAISAGFDGVEIHGANGYLVDQFIQEVTNKRSDSWGGSVPSRSRFATEVVRAVADVVGHDRTAIRLSPWGRYQGMCMEDPIPQYSHLVKSLADFDLAYLHLCESDAKDSGESLYPIVENYRKDSPVMVACNYTAESAVKAVDQEYKDRNVMVAFGKPYISNPDLPFRIKESVPFQPYDPATMYAQCPEGYVDYGFSQEFLSKK